MVGVIFGCDLSNLCLGLGVDVGRVFLPAVCSQWPFGC
jgi:hypothetical protein